jgi:hypothetical protein
MNARIRIQAVAHPRSDEVAVMLAWLIIIAAALLIIAACAGCERMQQASFNERFPPISDEEFVRRCGPGTSADIALRVRRVVANSLGIEYQRIHPSSRFVDDLGAD